MPAAIATLIDTGPIVASLNEKDARHAECKESFSKLGPFVYTCWPAITEVVYLLGDYYPATSKLFDLLKTQTIRVLSIDQTDLGGVEDILAKYADQRFQLADACLMHLANREGINQVLTLDRKDFSLFRTVSGKALTLLP